MSDESSFRGKNEISSYDWILKFRASEKNQAFFKFVAVDGAR